MSALLAFPVFIRRPDFGMHTESTEALDWFVIATLCFFFFLLGCFATAAWQIWRRTTHPESHVQLLMELHDVDAEKVIQNADENQSLTDVSPYPWEKKPDWWKR